MVRALVSLIVGHIIYRSARARKDRLGFELCKQIFIVCVFNGSEKQSLFTLSPASLRPPPYTQSRRKFFSDSIPPVKSPVDEV